MSQEIDLAVLGTDHAVGGPSGTPLSASVVDGIVPAYQTATAYTSDQQVSYGAQIYYAQTSFTSGASFAADGANWGQSSPLVESGASLGLTSLQLLPIQATATSSVPAVAGTHNPFDATSGNLTVTLPTGQPEGSLLSIEKMDSSANLVILNGNMRDTPSASLSLQLLHEQIILEADSSGSWWPLGSHKTLSSLDARYAALITSDLASSPSVVAAAAAAVSAVGALVTTSSDDDVIDVAFAIVDATGERSWLQISKATGGPTTGAASLIVSAIQTPIGTALGLSTGAGASTTGYSFVLLDSAGNISPHFQFGEDGRLTAAAIADLQSHLSVQAGSVSVASLGSDVLARLPSNPPALYVPQVLSGNLYGYCTTTGVRKLLSTGNSPVNAIGRSDGYITWTDNTGSYARKADASSPAEPQFHVAGAGIAASGDSMTAGVGSSAGNATTAYPEKLGVLLSITTYNQGYGSRTSTEIAIYQGGLNPLLTLSGGKLPGGATAAINVTDITPEHSYQQAQSWTYTGYITVGSTQYPGVLSWVGSGAVTGSTLGTFTFTPSSAPGSDVAVPAGTPFHCTDCDANTLRSFIVWAGINNIGVSPAPVTSADVAPDDATMLAHVGVYAKQFLVMGPIGRQDQPASSSYQALIRAVNTQLGGIYGFCTPTNPAGGNFFDLRTYLITNGLAAAGMTATSQDLIDIANGCVPTQLLFDGVEHPNDACYEVIATWVAAIIGSTGKGWLL